MLTQLIRYAGNLVDLRGLLRSSCQANFTSDDKDDDDDNVFDPLLDSEELVVINVDTAEPTDIQGDKGTPFLMDAEQKWHQQHIKWSQHQRMCCDEVNCQKKGPKGEQTLEKLTRQHTLQLKKRNGIKLYYLLAFFLAGGAAFVVNDINFFMVDRVLCFLFFEHIWKPPPWHHFKKESFFLQLQKKIFRISVCTEVLHMLLWTSKIWRISTAASIPTKKTQVTTLP
jgi:hypothetical protein